MVTLSESNGIAAIIHLQALAGIRETVTSAKTGWNNLTDSEKQDTMAVYNIFQDVQRPLEKASVRRVFQHSIFVVSADNVISIQEKRVFVS
jgi:hypothetical protein